VLLESREEAGMAGVAKDVRTGDWEAEVLGAEGPVLVDLWAEWCGPCRMVGPIVEEIAAEREGRLRVFKLNVDEEPEVAMRYGVSSIPTLLLLEGGEERGRVIGAMPKARLEAEIDRALARASA
jgi:thioredoxin 1